MVRRKDELVRRYCDTLFRHFRALSAVWPIGTAPELGDVMLIRDGLLEPRSQLDLQAMGVAVRVDPTQKVYDCTVGVRFHAGASVAADAGSGRGARFELGFEDRASLLFAAQGAQIERVADHVPLEHAIRERHRTGAWDPEYWIVTSRLRARALTVLVAEGKEARVVLEARATATPHATSDLIQMSLGASLREQERIGLRVVGEEESVPLVGLHRLHQPWIGAPRYRARSEHQGGAQRVVGDATRRAEPGGRLIWEERQWREREVKRPGLSGGLSS
ncbi:MAG TPA: hypothetical protein VGR37_02590 [Longimicrobiaceae bacterium]|nr:hypothetical protein [Longimicrobiaceae bacterium]